MITEADLAKSTFPSDKSLGSLALYNQPYDENMEILLKPRRGSTLGHVNQSADADMSGRMTYRDNVGMDQIIYLQTQEEEVQHSLQRNSMIFREVMKRKHSMFA